VQEVKWTEDKRYIEREWCIKHKRKKNRKRNGCVKKDSEEDRAGKSCRTMRRLVNCC
jgi:hypothetical protein